ncbi:hypothetical protein Tco_1022978, partial [Tanacetum coccineum]
RDDEEYVVVKENKYDDLMSTRKEAIHAYQENRSHDGRRMDGFSIRRIPVYGYGVLVPCIDLAGKEIDEVGEVSIIWNPMCVVISSLAFVKVCKVWDDWEVDRYGNVNLVIMEYLVKISKKARILELKQKNMKITVLTSYTPYPSRKIRRICACTSPKTTREQGSIRRIKRSLYAVFKLW